MLLLSLVLAHTGLADHCTELYDNQLVISYIFFVCVRWRVWHESEVNLNLCELSFVLHRAC